MEHPTGLTDLSSLLEALRVSNQAFSKQYPGVHTGRQPVHTLYGGAQLYRAGIVRKMGDLALRHFEAWAPDPEDLALALGGDGAGSLWGRIHARVIDKLRTEPVEDQRIDFEDGYGVRGDAEEDEHAALAAKAMAAGMGQGDLPEFIGIRIKSLSEEAKERALRTLDIFLSTLAAGTGGRLPDPFVVTLPKVTTREQVEVLAVCLDLLERKVGITPGSIRIELMIETVQSVLNATGQCAIPGLVEAGAGRVSAAILGTYDYTASCNIASSHQDHRHPSADFARQMMQASLTGTNIRLCDGITNVMPIAPHRGERLSAAQQQENRQTIHRAWQVHFTNILHSLKLGFYQSWDLNPAQLPVRYAAVCYFFLTGLADATARLKSFIDQAAQASMTGNTFDDAASAQGLLNFFLSGLACGALSMDEVLATGLTLEELRSRSFQDIMDNRLKGD